jgi:nitrite reductase/ring-hydroxylating ferredoxin subunit
MAVGDMLPGEMKEVETNVNGSKVLIVRNAAGKYYALSPKCPHFGAPMVTGALVGNRVLCPWHNASFSISTGKRHSAPAAREHAAANAHCQATFSMLHPWTVSSSRPPPPQSPSPSNAATPLHRYDVSISNGRVLVSIPASGTGSSKIRPMSKRDPTDNRVYATVVP